MVDPRIGRALIESVMDSIYELYPEERDSLTERGRIYAERAIRTSPEAAGSYCSLALAKPETGGWKTKVRWRDVITRLPSGRVRIAAESATGLVQQGRFGGQRPPRP